MLEINEWCPYLTALYYILENCLRGESYVQCSNHKTKQYRGQEETFVGEGYVYNTDCGNGFRGVHLSPNSRICTH